MNDELINKHKPVLLEEVISFIPKEKTINVIDATFGGGSYSKKISGRLRRPNSFYQP